MVIFGATGDLTSRKLVPALYNLALDEQLPRSFNVIGLARREWTDDVFRQEMLKGINDHSRRRPAEPTVWEGFSRSLRFLSSSFEDPAGYKALGKLLDDIEKESGSGRNRVFYLATPPSEYAT